MEIRLVGHDYKYGVEQIMLLLFPEQRPVYVDRDAPEGGAPYVRSELSEDGRLAKTALFYGGKSAEGEAVYSGAEPETQLLRDRERQKLVKLAFFRAATALTGVTPPWGALTGIRPGKLAERFMRETGLGKSEAAQFMTEEYYVTPERAVLCAEVAEAAETLRKSFTPNDISVYAGIPFCPTRCAYCSFVSQSVEKSFALIEPYLGALIKEIRASGEIVRGLGLSPASLYIGGGTPTTLTASQLERLMGELTDAFGGALREFTVEAGRPDTLDRAKLEAISRSGAGRISINPQTMNDSVLAAIGRRHSGAAVTECFELARSCFDGEINMDLIAGLPGDTPESFAASLGTVIALAPENITVHTLAMKRGSRLITENAPLPTGDDVAEMLSHAARALTQAGYAPYYLYRQKFSSGGFENIGWTKPGHTGIYNICVMEELHSILALGAGAVTKLTNPETGLLERISNKKYPKEYISSIDEIIAAKDYMRDFYAKMRAAGGAEK